MHRPRPPCFRRLAPLVILSVSLASACAPLPAAGQSDQEFRVGVTLGGISLVGLSFEYLRGGRSVDLTVGTWDFRDVSVSVVGKQYLGPGGLRPYFGAGLWGVMAFTPDGTGSVLIVRAPVGAEWRVVPGHAVGAAMNINRGLWVRRTDPDDSTPLNRRPVPLPGFYYRWKD